jgi:BMFP domain-containing protein YqiC
MAVKAREENEALKKRIVALEAHLGRPAPTPEEEPAKRGARNATGESGAEGRA